MRFIKPQWRPSLAKRRTRVRSVIDVSAFASILVALLFLFMPLQIVHPSFLPADLPRVEHASPEGDALQDDALSVTITRDGSVYFLSVRVSREDLSDMIQKEIRIRLDKTVYVYADSRVKYLDVKTVIDKLHDAGVTDITFMTAWSRR